MSFEAAIGRIDQILQFQQQVFDPGSATSSSSIMTGAGTSAVASGTSAASGGTSAADFASALASAQDSSEAAALTDLDPPSTSDDSLPSSTSQDSLYSNLDPASTVLASLTSGLGTSGLGTSGLGISGLGTSGLDTSASGLGALAASLSPLDAAAGYSGVAGAATSAADPRLQAMVAEANSLVGKPYVWGGGHSDWGPQNGYDCSGFVSAVLHAGGYLSSPQDTETLPSAPGIEPGPGQYVTIYDRDESGQEGHVIIDIGGQFYESGGEAGAWGGGSGVARIATPPASYLATFNDVLHPAGL